jgi:hypothetical protein
MIYTVSDGRRGSCQYVRRKSWIVSAGEGTGDEVGLGCLYGALPTNLDSRRIGVQSRSQDAIKPIKNNHHPNPGTVIAMQPSIQTMLCIIITLKPKSMPHCIPGFLTRALTGPSRGNWRR